MIIQHIRAHALISCSATMSSSIGPWCLIRKAGLIFTDEKIFNRISLSLPRNASYSWLAGRKDIAVFSSIMLSLNRYLVLLSSIVCQRGGCDDSDTHRVGLRRKTIADFFAAMSLTCPRVALCVAGLKKIEWSPINFHHHQFSIIVSLRKKIFMQLKSNCLHF